MGLPMIRIPQVISPLPFADDSPSNLLACFRKFTNDVIRVAESSWNGKPVTAR